MLAIAESLGPWTWWVLGIVMLGLEMLLPGTYLMWFGLAALSVGTFALIVPTTWTVQLLMFAGLSVVAVIIGRVVMNRLRDNEEDSGLNDRGARYVGRTFRLHEPIVDGAGRLNIDDTIWRVRGPDIRAGEQVRVVGADSSTLLVEGVEATP